MPQDLQTRLENLNGEQRKILRKALLEIETSEGIKVIEYTTAAAEGHQFLKICSFSGLGHNGAWDRYNGALLVQEYKKDLVPTPKLILQTRGEDPTTCKHEFEDMHTIKERTGFQAVLCVGGYWCRKCGRLESRSSYYPDENRAHIPTPKAVVDGNIAKAETLLEKKTKVLEEAEKVRGEAEYEMWLAQQAVWKAKDIRSERIDSLS